MLTKFWATLLLALLAAERTAPAQPNYLEPGSLLVYPLVDSRMGVGRGTVISVTNTNGNRVIDPVTGYRRGTTQVRFYYVTLSGSGWFLTDIPELLTPRDILTVLAGDHNPQTEIGWLFLFAEDPETEELIDFDYLVGDEVLVDVDDNRSVHVPAMAFRAVTEELNANPERSNLGYAFVDRLINGGNGNGAADFNGTEYQNWPDRLFLSSFFELENLNANTGDLILLSSLGADFRVGLRFLIYDNEEDQFSRSYAFICWTRVPLQDISAVVRNLHGSERPGTPVEEQQVGWMRINGDVAVNPLTNRTIQDPPVLGAVVQTVVAAPRGFEFGHLLHKTGSNGFSHNLPSTTITSNWP
jgi:hypothetical protein